METFYSMYPAVKHLHLTLIGVSVLFFMVRFVMKMRESALLERKLFKVAPHVIDTFLLLSGLTLCLLIKQYPFVDTWLTEKIMAVVAYILLAIMAMKSNRGKLFRSFAFLGALAWVVYAAKMAHFKQAILLAS
ncbi:SirB2 family protein [Shewanella cyperi]|uniref:SirB2 family protein n=1 Tax=Shewanella cyperi TaxID=2814292 RepID=A0A974XIS3_9GAMM|nr:SirB2 family protein [Shewanella cyperi]QSX29165.1 SirB2 family protein [Shewanella cyperi]QSX39910.1 SirB2 family protein [Shewanella cyperi]